MDRLENLKKQLAEVHASQARLAEMEQELKKLIADATAAAGAQQVQEAEAEMKSIYDALFELPKTWQSWQEDKDKKVHNIKARMEALKSKVKDLQEKGIAGNLGDEFHRLKTDYELYVPQKPEVDPDAIVVNASTPIQPVSSNKDEEFVPWTVDPAVLTTVLTPSAYVSTWPSDLHASDVFWLRMDKPIVNTFDIMNHFLSGSSSGYVQVPEEMNFILEFIHYDLVHISYDVSMLYTLAEAQAKAQECLDRYNELASMEDVVRYKHNLVQQRMKYDRFIIMPRGVTLRMHAMRFSEAHTFEPTNTRPASARQKSYLRSLLAEYYGSISIQHAMVRACAEFNIRPATTTLSGLTGGRNGTASILIAALLAKKRGQPYAPSSPTPSLAERWMAKNSSVVGSNLIVLDDDSETDSDEDLIDPMRDASRKDSRKRARDAQSSSSSSSSSGNSRLKPRASSSSEDDSGDDLLPSAAGRKSKKRREKFASLLLPQQYVNIRF